jgi:hypothetical protein
MTATTRTRRRHTTTFIDAADEFSHQEHELLKQATSVTVTKAWHTPNLSRDVLAPALLLSLFVFFFFAGIGLVSRVLGQSNRTNDDIWLGVALGMVVGGGIGAIVAIIQLSQFNRNQRVTRTYSIEGDRIVEVPVHRPVSIRLRDGDSATIGRFPWQDNQLAELARRTHDDYGQWKGPSKLTRKLLAGIIKNLNTHYPTILKDARDLGWVDTDNVIQQAFKDELRGRLFVPSTSPPQ